MNNNKTFDWKNSLDYKKKKKAKLLDIKYIESIHNFIEFVKCSKLEFLTIVKYIFKFVNRP